MRRRNFLKKIPLAVGTPIAISGIPLKVLANTSKLTQMAEQSTNDRVLIILQMHGGNDGLNAVIPIDEYDRYYSKRPNIAIPKSNSVRKLIPLDSTLATADQVGLHPDMVAMKDLYDRGRMGIVQGVSYKNNNGSHFRGRDIQAMGGDSDEYLSSGWVGRYLKENYAPLVYPDDFPNEEMKDPLAIELGNDVSLIFHQENNIPTSISLGNGPERFANLVEQLEGFVDEGTDPRGLPPSFLNNSRYGKEMDWILGLEDKTEDYAARLLAVVQRASDSDVTYPETYPFNAPENNKRNPLTPQLQLIAKLLDGGGDGVQTKVFLVKIGGFDTHAGQVEEFDPTMGGHASKLYHISSAMKAFQDDLKSRGLEDRVLTITTSEFGRRIESNGSYGTDHGTGAPLFIFGKGVKPGVTGTNPDLTVKNVELQHDYRQVYSTILKDWFETPQETVTTIFDGNFIDGTDEDGVTYQPLDLIQTNVVTGLSDFFSARFKLYDPYPNPATVQTVITYYLNAALKVKIELMDIKGAVVKTIENGKKSIGQHTHHLSLSGIKPGIYVVNFDSGILKDSKKLIIKQ